MADLLHFFKSEHAKDVHSDKSSLFIHPEEHQYVMPYIEEWKLLDNKGSTPSAFGATYSFELYDNGDLEGDCWLKLVVPAIAGGATNARFCDYGGLFTIEELNYYHGGVKMNTIKPEQILRYFLQKKTPEQIVAFQNLVKGNLSEATRITNGASAQTFYIPLIPYWVIAGNPSHFLPVKYIAGKSVTRIDIVFKPYTFFLQRDSGSPTITITTLQLLTRYYHLTAPQKVALQGLVDNGYEIKMLDMSQKILSEPLTSGSTEYSIKIDNLRSPVSELFFIVRTATDVQSTYNNNPTNFQSISSFSIEASGTNIVRADIIDENIDLYILTAEKCRGYAGTKIYCYKWTFFPLNDEIFAGSFDFQSVTNPILKIKFSSALGSNSVVDIYTNIDNRMRISSNGLKKLYN